MRRFPIHAPKVTVEPLNEERWDVQRRDIGGLLAEPNAECVTGFYYRYMNSGSPPLYFGHSRVIARLKMGDQECLEVNTRTYNPGDIERPEAWQATTYYYLLLPESFSCARVIHRRPDGTGDIRDITESPDPWRLSVGMKGGEATAGNAWEVTGAVRMMIGDRTFRCLRRINRFHFQGNNVRWFNEVYVSDAGRTVLTRGYESEKGDQFEHCEPETEVEMDGVSYRLLCDMIPDNALSKAEPARTESAAFTRFGRM